MIAGSDPELKEQNKPNAQPYLVCINRFENGQQIRPNQVLAFEDSPTGLKSAISAGCQTVLIPDPKIDPKTLAIQPSLILNSMNDFCPEYFGLPAFDDN